jgi:hypothetical protein
VRASLAHFREAELSQDRDHLAWFQDRDVGHVSGNSNRLSAHEFCLE